MRIIPKKSYSSESEKELALELRNLVGLSRGFPVVLEAAEGTVSSVCRQTEFN